MNFSKRQVPGNRDYAKLLSLKHLFLQSGAMVVRPPKEINKSCFVFFRGTAFFVLKGIVFKQKSIIYY